MAAKLCNRKDIHFVQANSNYIGRDQDCLGVNHFRFSIDGNMQEYLVQAKQYAKSNEIDLPLNTIYAEFHKADSSRFMDLQYHFNPEVDGFDKPKIAHWSSSDWHSDRVITAPKN